MLVKFHYNSKPSKKKQSRLKKIVSFKYSKIPHDQRKLAFFMSDIQTKQLDDSDDSHLLSINYLLGKESTSSTSSDRESCHVEFPDDLDFEAKNLRWKEKNVELTTYLSSYKRLYRILEQRKRVLNGLA
ncbi:BA75_00146T0 [Komagataella pastoris]|uniref:BA75_00146T0 n=1 Tax=Komagataella pastoris TaxID=4922 RepID=A0A1B2J8W1_PICPA|nr:BA75_00146T0 [Komagataella pastoris]